MEPYYEDDLVTLYHGDCREVTEWLDADVLVTDPPYGTESVGWDVSYGRGRNRRHGRTDMAPGAIVNDATAETRDEILASPAARGPMLVFGSPRRSDPPGDWVDRLVWPDQARRPTRRLRTPGRRLRGHRVVSARPDLGGCVMSATERGQGRPSRVSVGLSATDVITGRNGSIQ